MSQTATDPIVSAATPARLTLVLGGARSGKSRFAEGLIAASPARRVYLATAEPGDGEMAARIRHHRQRRGDGWTTIEEPLDLARTLQAEATAGTAVLVDCLTLWLSNLLSAGRDPSGATRDLVERLPGLPGRVIFVSNEVGLGIVPDNALARAFRDHAGLLHQAVAAAADNVYFMAAGLPLSLKP